jgi:hypothetical protein
METEISKEFLTILNAHLRSFPVKRRRRRD